MNNEQVRAAALEEAAMLCDKEREEYMRSAGDNNGRASDFAFGSVNSAERIAAAIRALATSAAPDTKEALRTEVQLRGHIHMLNDEIEALKEAAAPSSGESADGALDLAVACLHDAYSYVKDGGGDTGALDSALERIKLSRQAPAAHSSAPSLPDGWVALSIEFDQDGLEEVAYGPKRMMDKLGRQLEEYLAGKIAAALAAPAPTGESLPVQGVPEGGVTLSTQQLADLRARTIAEAVEKFDASADGRRLDWLYQSNMRPFIAPIMTKAQWIAAIDKAIVTAAPTGASK